MENIIKYVFLGSLLFFSLLKLIIIIIKIGSYTKVKGIVINTKKKYFYNSDSASKGAHNRYHFEYKNKIYDLEDKFYGGNPKLNKGDEIYFYVSKKNLDKFIRPEELYYIRYYVLTMLLSVGALILF